MLTLDIVARYNHTSYFYPTFSESTEHSHLLVSPVLVASAVIGVVIILSCITIIVGSIRRDRQARLQRHRHRRHRHHHHHHHRRRHRHREYEHGYGELPCTLGPGPPVYRDCNPGEVAAPPARGRALREGVLNISREQEELAAPDGHTYGRSSHRVRYACSPAEDWSPPLDISSDGDMDATVLRELYPDSPPGYEECVGPGATQLYVPTDAPPPYALTDSCPTLDGALATGSGHSPSRHQQAQRTWGQGDLHTISMDTLPPYEAVCGSSPTLDLLLLPGPGPGPGPGPRSLEGSPAPTRAPASGPERIV
ncbi:Protein BEAN1 [Tupaia chinensis]|uniref:Protein BEAN1 n=1 Tax=Tupaia chinensis TaxID=246437 RepID=L9K5P3_TUPCH|nr:Protein BEAN1 [Tupaia chinensis]